MNFETMSNKQIIEFISKNLNQKEYPKNKQLKNLQTKVVVINKLIAIL